MLGVGVVSTSYAANNEAHMTGAKVTAVSAPSLTVSYRNHSYTITTDNSTKIVRRFGAQSSLNQVSVGDHINVAGTWTDTSKTTVLAKLIRDGSIQEKNDTFVGTVSSLTSNGFVLQTMNRGQQTVSTTSTTKIVDRKGMTLALSSIVVNDKVKVDGLWDRTLKTVTATTIRDNSQPARKVKPTGTK